MNLFRINFEEVYRRHLCRHGHFGINILHLIVVLVIYVALFGLAGKFVQFISPDNEALVLLSLIVPWFLTVCANVPLRVTFVTAACTLMLLATYLSLPPVPVWIWIPLIFAMHHFQQYSHKLYPMHRDMSAFKAKYPKGPLLFTLLLVYELPILLNYLFFGRPDWVFGSAEIRDLPQPTENVA